MKNQKSRILPMISIVAIALIVCVATAAVLIGIKSYKKSNCVELELYTSSARSSESDDWQETVETNGSSRIVVDSKRDIINILKSAQYEETDYLFDESEILCIGFIDATVWYAVEYSTEDIYAVYDDIIYKVKSGENLVAELGSYLETDRYKIINYELGDFGEQTVFDGGSRVHETAECRTKRFFYNDSYRSEYLVIPEDGGSASNGKAYGFSVSENAADILGIEIYETYVCYDDITDTWFLEIYDEGHHQKVEKEAYEAGGELLSYDRCWHVVANGDGKVLYYFDYYKDLDGYIIGPKVEDGKFFDATVIHVYTNALLVTPLDGEEELSAADKIYVNGEQLDGEMPESITEGSIVRISYYGNIRESYPADISEVFRIYHLRGESASAVSTASPLELKKDSIPNTDNWQTAGLESAGLAGVDIGEPYTASFGKLYVLRNYSGVFCDTFFAIETEDTVWLREISRLNWVDGVYVCDVDGIEGDEIVLAECVYGSGANSATVYKVTEKDLVSILDIWEFDMGYSSALREPYEIVIKNEGCDYEAVHKFSPEEDRYNRFYDKNGKPVDPENQMWLSYYDMEPKDVDNDGVFELVTKHFTCLFDNRHTFGSCRSVLKYDKREKGFKVVDAEFVSYGANSGLYDISYEEGVYTYHIYDKSGNIICDDFSWREPNISMVSDNIVEVCIQKGTGLSTNWAMFFDTETGEISETFYYVLGAEGDYVIMGDYDPETDERSIVVQNIFDSSKYSERYVLENASPVAADFANIESLGDGKWKIFYLAGEDYQKKTVTIQLP